MAFVAVYGSALPPVESLAREARETGRLLARAGHVLVTGACQGITHYAVLGAAEVGGSAIGYSPATTLMAHRELCRDPENGFSELVFVPETYPLKANQQACYKYRNIATAALCDCAVIINGGIGTLNEFTLAYDFGKIIAVLEGTGGVADRIRSLMDGLPGLRSSARIVFGSNAESLVNQLNECLRGGAMPARSSNSSAVRA